MWQRCQVLEKVAIENQENVGRQTEYSNHNEAWVTDAVISKMKESKYQKLNHKLHRERDEAREAYGSGKMSLLNFKYQIEETDPT